jgi:nucleotide-binding universal stress UspA family protein
MYRRILVPTDGSIVSARAEKTAIDLAKKFRASVTIVHVMAPWSPHALGEVRGLGTEPLSREEYDKVTEKRGKAAVRRVATRAKRAGVRHDVVLATDDSPGDALVRTAAQSRSDLIVMASHSRVGIERIFLGSVAADVLSGTRTPVLICH